jgi:Nuclease-related domain
MTSKRREDGRACGCDQHDASCVGLTVHGLSSERVAELAEEIWTASTGRVLPARPIRDPRSSRPGASAQAAYQRRRQQELRAWLHGWWWRALAVVGAAAGVDLLVGLTVGAWLGSLMALVAALVAGWRLRFRPSASASPWRRQAAAQRRTASALQPLKQRGDLVLHDVTLPGWPASLEHLVIGSTGVWVIQAWEQGQRPRRHTTTSSWTARGVTADPLPKLRWQAAVFADMLAGERLLPVRPLLCVPGGRLAGRQPVKGVTVATTRQLVDVIRQGAPLPAADVDRATTRALELLRPAV